MEFSFDTLLSELTKSNYNKIQEYDRILPFDDIFGDKERILEEFSETNGELASLIYKELELFNYNMDPVDFLVYRAADFPSKKNPTKLGKTLTLIKKELLKSKEFYNEISEILSGIYKYIIKKDNEPENDRKWNTEEEFKKKIEESNKKISEKNQIKRLVYYEKEKFDFNDFLKHPELGYELSLNWLLHVFDYIKTNIKQNIHCIDTDINIVEKLLKVQDIVSQLKSESKELSIIYSRNKLDLIRMSDHSEAFWSCHAPTGSHFDSAMCESVTGGAIAYLVNTKDINEFLEEDPNGLQREEIFLDKERNINGISPISRIRIRLLEDASGKQIPLPEIALYGNEKNLDSFKSAVLNWCINNAPKNIDWESPFTYSGGSYEDNKIDLLVNRAFNKIIKYQHNSSFSNHFLYESILRYAKNELERGLDEYIIRRHITTAYSSDHVIIGDIDFDLDLRGSMVISLNVDSEHPLLKTETESGGSVLDLLISDGKSGYNNFFSEPGILYGRYYVNSGGIYIIMSLRTGPSGGLESYISDNIGDYESIEDFYLGDYAYQYLSLVAGSITKDPTKRSSPLNILPIALSSIIDDCLGSERANKLPILTPEKFSYLVSEFKHPSVLDHILLYREEHPGFGLYNSKNYFVSDKDYKTVVDIIRKIRTLLLENYGLRSNGLIYKEINNRVLYPNIEDPYGQPCGILRYDSDGLFDFSWVSSIDNTIDVPLILITSDISIKDIIKKSFSFGGEDTLLHSYNLIKDIKSGKLKEDINNYIKTGTLNS